MSSADDNLGSKNELTFVPIEASRLAVLASHLDRTGIWVNNENMTRLHDAASNHRTEYVLTTGLRMQISYRGSEEIYVSPKGGEFAPCGHFTIKGLAEKLT